MKKATRLLLAERPESLLVTVENISHAKAKPNNCYDNTMLVIDEDENFILASGWLVGDFVGGKGTAIIPHYWVIDKNTKKHFDPTPQNAMDNFEYVWDLDIAELCLNYKCALPLPLLLSEEGNFKIRVRPDEYVHFDNFNLNNLFQLTIDS